MSSPNYVHGYDGRENERLFDQANTLGELLHHDTVYPADSEVLEAGCGVGAQTIILARRITFSCALFWNTCSDRLKL
jgi:methylase of polypeptide subunit release factors